MTRDSLKTTAYDAIKEKIITCEIPPATLISEAMLIEELGMSRTPVREALCKLEQERLVKIVSKKGIMVSDISIRDIRDLYQVRELLEPLIIRLWGCEIPTEELVLYRKACENALSGDVLADKDIDDRLHRMVIAASGNKYFTDMLVHLQDWNYRVRVISGCSVSRVRESIEEHIAITDYLIEGDTESAAEKMTQHLKKGRQAAFDRIISTK